MVKHCLLFLVSCKWYLNQQGDNTLTTGRMMWYIKVNFAHTRCVLKCVLQRWQMNPTKQFRGVRHHVMYDSKGYIHVLKNIYNVFHKKNPNQTKNEKKKPINQTTPTQKKKQPNPSSIAFLNWSQWKCSHGVPAMVSWCEAWN